MSNTTNHVPVPVTLTKREYNGYSNSAQANKDGLHRAGKTFLRKLAARLGLEKGDFDVRSNVAGIAVSGEVTLHGDNIYMQLFESFSGPGLQLMYRGCKHRRDYCGYQNMYASMADLSDEHRQDEVIRRMKQAIKAAEDISKLEPLAA